MSSSIRVALILLAVALLCHCSDNPTKPNWAPVLASIAPQNVREGERLEFLVQATDQDGTIPTLSARNVPTNASAVDSGNGTMLFVFEPDFTQSGIYDVTFIAFDGRLTDSLTVTITVTPYSVGELWPMAVGNYWVYETKGRSQSEWTLDSIHVQSSYQSEGATHWRLSGNGFLFIGNDIAVRNDSIIGIHHKIAQPAVWPDRADTVLAGIFEPAYVDCQEIFSLYRECLVFAKNVGVIRYEWIYLSAHYPGWYDARLVRYFIK
jgi:hypothetical protein